MKSSHKSFTALNPDCLIQVSFKEKLSQIFIALNPDCLIQASFKEKLSQIFTALNPGCLIQVSLKEKLSQIFTALNPVLSRLALKKNSHKSLSAWVHALNQ